MSNRSRAVRACVVGVCIIVISDAVRAGDLNPPPGPVAPTMKSLDALRAGRCVNDLPGAPDAVHVISEPGVYFLNGPVDVPAGKHGIKVEFGPGIPTTSTSGVSLDLAGFPVTGAPGSLDGVHVVGASGVNVLAIQSGASPASIGDLDGDGLDIDDVSSVEIRNIAATHCGGAGMRVRINELEARLKNLGILACVVSDNGGDGLDLELAQSTDCVVSVERCIASRNAGSGMAFRWRQLGGPFAARSRISVRDSDASSGNQAGIVVDYAHSDPLSIDVEMENVSCSRNGGPGFATGVSPGTCTLRVAQCSFDENAGSGLDASGMVSGTVRDRFGNVVLDSCRAGDNGGHGFHIAGKAASAGGKKYNLLDCFPMRNAQNGFHIEQAPGMRSGCDASRNTLNGYFETGKIPTEEQFSDLIDSVFTDNGADGVHAEDVSLSLANVSTSGNVGDGLDVSLDAAAHASGIRKNITVNLFKSHKNGGHGMRAARVDAVVRDSHFAHLNGSGNLTDSARLTMEGCTFSECGLGPGGAEAVRVIASPRLVLRDCTIDNTHGDGMLVADSGSVLVERITILASAARGFAAESFTGVPCGSVTLLECLFDSNGADGCAIACSSGGEVRGCVSRGNGGAGYSAPGAGHVFIWNTAADNGGPPFLVAVPGNSLAPMLLEGDVVVGAGAGYSNFVR